MRTSDGGTSEGPEVRRTADRLAAVPVGRRIEGVEMRRRLNPNLQARIEDAIVRETRTYGKHVVIAFSGGVCLHDHMMMFGRWRVYSRNAFDAGKAKPPRA